MGSCWLSPYFMILATKETTGGRSEAGEERSAVTIRLGVPRRQLAQQRSRCSHLHLLGYVAHTSAPTLRPVSAGRGTEGHVAISNCEALQSLRACRSSVRPGRTLVPLSRPGAMMSWPIRLFER